MRGRTILVALTALALCTPAGAALIDFGQVGQRVEVGAVGISQPLDGGDVAPTPIPGTDWTIAVDNVGALGGTFGALRWLDRGNSPVDENLVRIGEDLVLNEEGVIRVVIEGLPARPWLVTSYHVDPVEAHSGQIEVFVTDARGIAQQQTALGNANILVGGVDGLAEEIVQATAARFPVVSAGPDQPVEIVFNGRDALMNAVPLSGLEIVIPEPATLGLLAVGGAGALLRRRR